ncbi:MAG: SDR family oxidoreductase [Bacteroidales bacterium]|nr:SDR family oxidoreductase [Clostridium sp.]MCM1204169.1 SDR family oxidoreductase [Bacteroidales bacterium]
MKKYAVITGASAGLGTEFAKRLSAKGYNLVLVARREERLKKLASHLKTECEIIAADLTKEEECRRVYGQIREMDVEIFINNAGFGDCGNFTGTELRKEIDMIQLNIKAVHLFTKLMLQEMQRRDEGYILNVASCAGLMPAGPYMATYYATKAYVTSFTRAVAEELRECGSHVYVGCLCPGPVNTEFNRVANVRFMMRGISADYCVRYALSRMAEKKVVIIPGVIVKLALAFGRLLPGGVYVHLAAKQQVQKIQ